MSRSWVSADTVVARCQSRRTAKSSFLRWRRAAVLMNSLRSTPVAVSSACLTGYHLPADLHRVAPHRLGGHPGEGFIDIAAPQFANLSVQRKLH